MEAYCITSRAILHRSRQYQCWFDIDASITIIVAWREHWILTKLIKSLTNSNFFTCQINKQILNLLEQMYFFFSFRYSNQINFHFRIFCKQIVVNIENNNIYDCMQWYLLLAYLHKISKYDTLINSLSITE